MIVAREVSARQRMVAGGDFGRRSLGDQSASGRTTAGTQLDHVIGSSDQPEMVLDDDDRVTNVEQCPQALQQSLDVGRMQPRRGVLEQEQRAAVGSGREERGELQPLGLATGKRRGGLAQGEVFESDIAKRLQSPPDRVLAAKVAERLFDGHLEHVGDRAAPVSHLEDLAAKPATLALGTRGADVGQELHVDFDLAAAPTHLATTSSCRVEAELTSGVAPLSRLGGCGEQASDVVKGLEHRGGDRPGRAAQG